MMRLGTLWGYSADYTPLEEEVARISRISLDDLRGVAERYPLEPTVRIAVVPEDHAEAQTPA
jgi:predicted Zn-dependent peptidase